MFLVLAGGTDGFWKIQVDAGKASGEDNIGFHNFKKYFCTT